VEADGNVPNYGYYTFLVGDNNNLTSYATTFAMNGAWTASTTSNSIMIMRKV
jgi:hypothetical protein